MSEQTPPEVPAITTRVAYAGYSEHAFCGRLVYEELAGKVSLSVLAALSVSGRLLSDDDAQVLDDLAACWTLAEPRIWPLKVARLGAGYGGFLEGLAAGFIALDCTLVGHWGNVPPAARWMIELARTLGDEVDQPQAVAREAQALVARHRYVPGFGVPFREEDERVPPLRRCLKQRGRDQRPFVTLLDVVAEAVRGQHGMPVNIAGLVAAVCLDLGFTPEQLAPLLTLLGCHMIVANAHEGALLRSEVLRRLPDAAIRYVGRPPRVSPQAAAHVPKQRL